MLGALMRMEIPLPPIAAEPLPPLQRQAHFRRNVALAIGIRYVMKEEVGASLYRYDLSHF